MKKILSLLIVIVFSATLYAQKEVTKFLGIPVDGSKSSMIWKLKEKGFTSVPWDKDRLTGEFNGEDVGVYILTNRNKVWRIAVVYKTGRDVAQIRLSYNQLCRQFDRNKKYIRRAFLDYTIPADEDIATEIKEDKSKYQAAYYQLPVNRKSLDKEIQSVLRRYFTEEELASPTAEQQDRINGLIESCTKDECSDRIVWFDIAEGEGKYYIWLYYDNPLNRANGEDL